MQKIQELLFIILYALPAFSFLILAPIYASPTPFVHNYLLMEKIKRNEIQTGCLYFYKNYYKFGKEGYFFKINNVIVKDIHLTTNNLPFSKKEMMFLNNFNQKNGRENKNCYLVKYAYIKFLFKEQVLIYDLI